MMFIVMESSAQVRGKMRNFGRYRRIAVCEVEEGKTPAMISERARGMIRIVQEWSPMHQGKTERSEYWVARREAEGMAKELNETAAGP